MSEQPPLATGLPPEYRGSYELRELGLTRRWMEASELPRELTPQILELLRVAFNGGPHWFSIPVPPLEHFDWKYRDYPGGAGIILSLDEHGAGGRWTSADIRTGRGEGCVGLPASSRMKWRGGARM